MENLSEFIKNNTTPLTYFGMVIAGIAYACYIFFYPTQKTWVSVVAGSAIVVIGSFVIIYSETGSIWLALTPFFCNIAAGIWQIIAQEFKQYHIEQLAHSIKAKSRKEAGL